MKLKIKKSKFVDWYFNFGTDDEIVDTKIELANLIIEQLEKNYQSSISLNVLLDNCNPDIIPLNIVEGFKITDDRTIEDLDAINYTIDLID